MRELPKVEALEEICNGNPESIANSLAALGFPLPDFIRESISPSETFTLVKKGEKYVVRETNVEYDTLREAYANTKGAGKLVEFDESLDSVLTYNDLIGCYQLESEGHTYLFHSGIDMGVHYAEEYANFLIAAVKYRADPDNLATVWSFIERHPAFWVKKGREGSKTFATDEGAGLIEFCVYPDESKGNITKVALEMGGHNESDNYETRYLDVLLVSTAGSIDEAVLILARKVEKYYDYSGKSTVEADNERSDYFERKGWNRKTS